MEEKVLELLKEEFADIDFTSSETLVDDGIIDSLTVSSMVVVFSEEFDVEIPFDEIVEENFNSIAGMARMIERLKG